MTRIFVGFGLSFGLLLTAACNDASAQVNPSSSKTGRAPPAQTAPASEEQTCSKFLPNVGLVMAVPCSNQQLEILPVVTAMPPAKALSPPPRLTATAPRKASHRASQKTCSEILQRIQLDDARDDDQEQLRNGC